MSSTPSLPNESGEAGAGTPPLRAPRRTGLVMAVTIGLLATLVWALNPPRSRLTPAKLHPLLPGCPKLNRPFVPTNITSVAAPPVDTLPEGVKYRVLYRLNMEACSCGCGQSIAACRSNNPDCAASLERAKKIVSEVGSQGAAEKPEKHSDASP